MSPRLSQDCPEASHVAGMSQYTRFQPATLRSPQTVCPQHQLSRTMAVGCSRSRLTFHIGSRLFSGWNRTETTSSRHRKHYCAGTLIPCRLEQSINDLGSRCALKFS